MWTDGKGADYFYDAERFAKWCEVAYPKVMHEWLMVKAVEDKANESTDGSVASAEIDGWSD